MIFLHKKSIINQWFGAYFYGFHWFFGFFRRFRPNLSQRLKWVGKIQNILGPSTQRALSNGTTLGASRQTFKINNWPTVRTFFGIFSSGDVDHPTCGASCISRISWKSTKSSCIWWNSMILHGSHWFPMIFWKSAKYTKLHRSIGWFFKIFIRIYFALDVQKTHFRTRCDRYRDDGVALRFWKSRKSWNFKGASVIQSQWFGDPRKWGRVKLERLWSVRIETTLRSVSDSAQSQFMIIKAWRTFSAFSISKKNV